MPTKTGHKESHTKQTGGGISTRTQQIASFTERGVRELFGNKAVLFWSIAFPVGFYLLTISLFIDTSQTPDGALPYVKAGTAVTYGTFGAIIASLNAFGQQLAMDFEEDRYELLRSLPVSASADLVGRMVAGIALSVLALLSVLGVAVLTDATFTLKSAISLPVVAVAILSFTVFWMVVAVAVTTLIQDSRYASIITVSMALALYFLTGFNGGNPSMFQGSEQLLNWLPNTLPTRLIVEHIAATPAQYTSPDRLAPPSADFGVAIMSVYAIVAFGVGLLIMRRGVYKRSVLP